MSYLRCLGSEIGKDWGHPQGKPDQFDLCDKCFAAFQLAEANQVNSWELFANETEEGKFEHFFPSEVAVKLCGPNKVVKVKLTLDPDGPYWGWLESHHPANYFPGKVSMIYQHPTLVEICFAYGTKADTKLGRGKVVRLKVEKV